MGMKKEEAQRSCSSIGFGGMDDDQVENVSSREDDDRCSTRRIVKSQCKTEEVEPGKFVRKCEKTEQILKECVGKPVEVVKSTTEYTEDDVTNKMGRASVPSYSSELEPFNFPGLRSDIEALEKSMFGGLSRFFDAAEDRKNGFYHVFGTPHQNEGDSPSSSFRGRTSINGQQEKETSTEQRNDESVYSDFAGQVRDV